VEDVGVVPLLEDPSLERDEVEVTVDRVERHASERTWRVTRGTHPRRWSVETGG
jgi:hypothetical protein